jgi:hypothetical protein
MFSQKNRIAVAIALLSAVAHAQNYSCSAAQISNINALRASIKTSSGLECACQLLTDIFPTKVLTTNSSAYEAQATDYWDRRSDLAPGCIFVPDSPNEVAVGVVIFKVCQSQFAVRGGGHMPVSQFLHDDPLCPAAKC